MEADLTIANAHIMFRNFTGAKSTYNREGKKTFSVVIPDDELANQLLADHWNVRILQPREEGDEPLYILKVIVNFGSPWPPIIKRITSNNEMILTDNDARMLDKDEIKEIPKLEISAYHWKTDDGKSGISAYLQSMEVVIDDEEFATRYRLRRE